MAKQPTPNGHLKTAISLDPQFAEAHGNLGVLYGQQGKSAEAEELLRKAIENNPKYAQAYVNLGLILAGEGRFPEAEKEIREAVGPGAEPDARADGAGHGGGQAWPQQGCGRNLP